MHMHKEKQQEETESYVKLLALAGHDSAFIVSLSHPDTPLPHLNTIHLVVAS